MTTWDQSVDLVIAGSGGGGVVAALVAIDAGLEPLVLEKQAIVGGSTGMSGGIIWMPNNPLMRAEGVADSHEDGLAYLEDVVGDAGPRRRRSDARRSSPRATRCSPSSSGRACGSSGAMATATTTRTPGRQRRGRSVEGVPFDARQLGEWHDKLHRASPRVRARGEDERAALGAVLQPLAATFAIAARVFLRSQGRRVATSGSAHQRRVADRADAEGPDRSLGRASGLDEHGDGRLVVEDGRVVGVRGPGTARRPHRGSEGVLLAAGGFAHNAEMRRKYSGNQPNEAQWSIANVGDTGEVLETAMRLGAKTDLLDEAWWLPSTGRSLAASSLVAARQRPRAIFVDSTGQRFCNESNSYVEVGKAMYADKAVPCWLIFDEGYCRAYAPSANPLQRRLPEEAFESGAVRRRTRSRSWHARSASIPSGWPARCNGSTSTPSRT